MSHKEFFGTTDCDIYGGFLYFCISHLTGNSTFPNQLVEFLFLRSAFNGGVFHIGRTDGFVSLLSTFRTGMILTHFAIFFAIEFRNFLLAGIDTQAREVDGVCTHIGNLSVLVQMLGNNHRLADGKAQFAGSFLLKRRRGEGGSGRALHGFLDHRFDSECSILALLQEVFHFLVGFQTLGKCGLDLCLRTIGIGKGKDTIDAIVWLAVETLDFTLALNY